MSTELQRAPRDSSGGAQGGAEADGAGTSGEGWRETARGLDFDQGTQLLAAGDEGAQGAGTVRKSFTHWVQSGLNVLHGRHGFLRAPLAVDGVPGAQTRAGVKAFQRQVTSISSAEPKLAVDGEVGAGTTGALERALGEKNPAGRRATDLEVARELGPPEATGEVPEGAPDQEATSGHAQASGGSTAHDEGGEGAAPEGEVAEPGAGGGDAGAVVEAQLPPTEGEVQALVEAAGGERGADSGGGEGKERAETPGSDADLAKRLEAARAELGKVKEKAYKGVPPLMSEAAQVRLRKTLAAKVKPGQSIDAVTVWFAADQHSLERLVTYAKTVGLDYEQFIARNGGGYAWCGSFVAEHYGMGATLTSQKYDKKTKTTRSATVGASAYLASTYKSHKFFTYREEWKGAYARDAAVGDDAPVVAQYKPIVAHQAAHGGAREWHPIGAWKGNPEAVAKPGMVLFVKGNETFGDHMIFVDRVEPDGKGGWIVHTVEGNAVGAKTKAFHYAISASGQTDIKAVARPAPLDFDRATRYVDAATYAKLLRGQK